MLDPSTGLASSIDEKIVYTVEDVEEPQNTKLEYSDMTVAELKNIATEKGIEFDSKIKKAELIEKLG
ncbi:HeH/LEM domain [uncultured Clostridium sp.]|nr:HeH/LEM domain [uncultured Clostridium sp.]